jgi:hypothetical protein
MAEAKQNAATENTISDPKSVSESSWRQRSFCGDPVRLPLPVSLARAGRMLHARDSRLHCEWMLRAISVLRGIATTRPVVGVFFATERITHLRPAQFFAIAFWIGFTTTYIVGEAYIRSHPMIAE